MDNPINDDAQTQDNPTQGDPQVDATLDAQAEPAPQPTVEPEPTVEDTATTDRYKQDNAQLRATLIKLGVDPDSSDADNLRNGYVSVEDFVAAKFGSNQPQAQSPTEPEQSAEEILSQIDSMVNSVDGQVSVDQYQKIERLKLDLNKKLLAENNNLKQQREQDQKQREYESCMSACRTTYQTDDTFKSLPTDAQAKAAGFIESLTDLRVGNLAGQIGWDNAAKPQVMQQETAKVLQEFSSMVQALSGTTTPAPAARTQNVAPVVIGSGPGQPISTPRPRMDVKNLASNVDKYLSSMQGQV